MPQQGPLPQTWAEGCAVLLGTGWLGAVLFPSASALPLTNQVCLLAWIPLSYFAFPPPFQLSFLSYLCFKHSSLLAFWLFSSICIFPFRPFFHSCFSSLAFSAMHFHPGVSFLPALPSVNAHLLCSILSKLMLASCSNCPKSPAKPRSRDSVMKFLRYQFCGIVSCLFSVSGSSMLPSFIFCFFKGAKTGVKGQHCGGHSGVLAPLWPGRPPQSFICCLENLCLYSCLLLMCLNQDH